VFALSFGGDAQNQHPEEDEGHLRRVVNEGLSPLLLGLAILCALFIVVDLFTMPRRVAVRIVAHHGVLVVAFVALWLAIRRGAIRESFANPVAGLAGGLMLTIVLHSLLALRDPFHTVYALVLIIGFGCVFLSWGWLLASILVTAAGWALATWPLLPAGAAHDYVLGVVVAAALSLIVHTGRMRTHRRIERMRAADRRLNAELTRALEVARTELDERQRAEREREQMAERLRHSHKMEAVGALAGGVAHELNNVLGVITGLASVLKRESASGNCGGSLPDIDKILGAARRGSAFTRSLLGFVRKETLRRERFSLNEVVQDVAEILERTVAENIEIETLLSAQLPEIQGDPHQLTEAVMNLCFNSVQAMPKGGTITLSTSEKAGKVWLVVDDDGTGMTAETLERAFEPFFTTKPPGRGTGLGLSMVFGTVKGHRGEVDIESTPGEGTRVLLTLPVADAIEPAAGPEPLPAGEARPGHGTLLMVDDDEMIRAMSRRVLETLGYRVLLAENGAEALDVYTTHVGAVDLVILDLAMPVMNGFDCFHRLKEIDPGVRILLSSGYAMESKTRELLAEGARGFLKKPYDQDEFGHAIMEALS